MSESFELTPFHMNDEQKAFVIKMLADPLTSNDALHIKTQFDKLFYPKQIKAEAIIQLGSQYKDDIKKLRQEIYDDLSTLPFSYEYTRIAFAQSRIKFLLENPKYKTSKRQIDDKGKEYYEDVREIDEQSIKAYLDFCRQEAYSNKKLALEKILNGLDGNDPRLPKSGFKPVEINVGFTVSDETEQT